MGDWKRADRRKVILENFGHIRRMEEVPPNSTQLGKKLVEWVQQ